MSETTKGYKVFNPDFTCKDFKYEVGKTYTHEGPIEICERGFHFCLKAAHCFNYYSFNPENIVCEVEAVGKVLTHDGDSKICTDKITILRKLSWAEVLIAANDGLNNTGHSNSGAWNSGDRNSGDRNSGAWNSGDRNSGDSNSGYRNSGAFCLDNNPVIYLFDKPTDIKVRDWENHKAIQIMREHLELTIWVPTRVMTDKEKKANPKYETTDGYLKTITLKEGWKNMWGNLSEAYKKVFTTLPNFSWKIFTEITGIKENN